MGVKILVVVAILAAPAAWAEKKSTGAPGERDLVSAKDAQCGPVSAKTLIEVCNAYATQQGFVDCLKAGKDAEFDPCALGFCNTYKTEGGCTACITTVRNKTYTVEDISACNTVTTESLATSCMDAVGTESGSVVEVLTEGILDAILLLEEGKVTAARKRLEELLE